MRRRSAVAAVLTCGILAVTAPLAAPLAAQGERSENPLSHQALRPSGQSVIPVFDGWFPNPDGSRTLCFGYFNRNTGESLDVPLGPENRIEPGRWDGLQPTHFDPVPDPELTAKYRHHWCVFTVTVPGDFEDDVWWTLVSHGDTLRVPGTLGAEYVLDEITSPGRNQEAPTLRLAEDGPAVQGRRGIRSRLRRIEVEEPLTLTARVEHPEPGTWLGWTLHQGPGPIRFSEDESRVDRPKGSASTTVTFDEPGRYVIRIQAINDREYPGNPTYGFEFHCCWTNGYFDVEVVE